MRKLHSNHGSRWLINSVLSSLLILTTTVSHAQLVHDPDINDDGVVNILDVIAFENCFLTQPTVFSDLCSTSDLNADGSVNFGDLAAIAAHYLEDMPTPAEANSLFSGIVRPLGGSIGLGTPVIVDVNGDGLLDILAQSYVNNKVTVLFGDNEGTYLSSAEVAVSDPLEIAVGDIDRDGFQDLLVRESASLIRAYTGDGTGQFEDSGVAYESDSNSIHKFTLATLNDDPYPDIVFIGSSPGNQVSVLLAGPTGGFLPPVNIPLVGAPFDLDVADFNGDDVQDILVLLNVSFNDDRVVLLRGTGDGSFQMATSHSSLAADSVSVGDIDGDGAMDLLLNKRNFLGSDGATGSVNVLRNNGGGSFSQFGFVSGLLFPSPAAVASVNDDQIPDLMVSDSLNGLAVYAGDGQGGFTAEDAYSVNGAGNLQFADLDGDGRLDLIATSSYVTILNGKADGGFGGPKAIKINDNTLLRAYHLIEFEDMNNDGKPDFLTYGCEFSTQQLNCSLAVNGLYVGLGNGEGQFQSSGEVTFLHPGSLSLITGYFNNDNNLDIARRGLFNNLIFYAGLGDGQIGEQIGSYSSFVKGDPTFIAADMDGDQIDELVDYGNFGPTSIARIDENGQAILLGQILTGGGVNAVTAADFNHDNFQDLALAVDTDNQNIALYHGDGSGNMVESARFESGRSSVLRMLSADVNNDGNEDLIAGGNGRFISILLGNNDGSLAPPFLYQPGTNLDGDIAQLAIGDLNNDANLDLVFTTTDAPEQVNVSLGNGDGGFQKSVNVYTGGLTHDLELVDINGDNRLDIATASGRSYVSVALQN